MIIHWWIVQRPWPGRYTSGEVLVLALSGEYMVEARGMEVAHVTLARAVVLWLVTSFRSWRRWTSLRWNQGGKLMLDIFLAWPYILWFVRIYVLEIACKLIATFFNFLQWKKNHIQWQEGSWSSVWENCCRCALSWACFELACLVCSQSKKDGSTMILG